jgi:hypothetical protein
MKMIMMGENQCCGSRLFWYGSRSSFHFDTNPDPDTAFQFDLDPTV